MLQRAYAMWVEVAGRDNVYTLGTLSKLNALTALTGDVDLTLQRRAQLLALVERYFDEYTEFFGISLVRMSNYLPYTAQWESAADHALRAIALYVDHGNRG